ncbi:Utp14 protein-domain-containing protein [Colletotrichum godetiae]|uniref:Utp14 protein-domain-containing protein n=1 Tax=Colletotrichum godetiae TaxID=1209918 RepID=A0AAJ0ARN5_9PEZI|nr:Utp14 protein-domain-containing protein [Colletotrichum godetiae]KAK1689129.1 Utp14 protein-domain-containing protein [Colletotrichum godetiae]
MPPGRQSHGRQAHGRPLLSAKPAAKTFRKSKNKAQVKALDAFTTASELYAPKEKRTPRFREIEAAPEDRKKRRAADDDDDEDGEDEDEDDDQPRRKKAKPSAGGGGDDYDEYFSDSDGNEWHHGVNEDEDSEIDSDEAFGDSDHEDFQGYGLGGSKGKKGKQDDSDEEDDEDDDESLGEDAIDLAQALDEYESDESMADQEGQDDSDASDSEAESPPSSDEDEDDQEADPSKLGDLQKFIAGFGGDDNDEDAAPTKQKQKISFKDLGLSGVKDAQMRKSVKLMAKEEKEASRPGAGKKLEVPLYKRQQDRLARGAAYEKASETIGRWQETVKQNRRADHLVFPLPQNAADEGLDNRELQAITAKTSTGNELEQTILNIMQASGLAMNKQEENARAKAEREEGMSKEALQDMIHQRRRERELASRETKRAARIKKIKSKAYHRVHRKEKEREAAKLKEAMAENGDVEIDSEAERDAQDRARVLERVGARHRDSKWAKLGSSNKRAVWDDEYRAGLHDMARREEELRRRKEGRVGGSDEEDEEADDSESDDGSEDEEGTGRRSGMENRRLLKQLEGLDNEEDEEPKSDLMKMKFMQKAEAQQKKANDELIAQIRRDLDSDREDRSDEDDDDEVAEVGRKKYGSAAQPAISAPTLSRKQKKAAAARGDDLDTEDVDDAPDNSAVNTGYSLTAEPSTTGSAWSSGPRKKSAKTGGKSSGARVEDLDNSLAITAGPSSSSSKKSKSKSSSSSATKPTTLADEDTSSSDDSDSDSPTSHLPLAIRDISQMDKAFAGDDVVVDFAREKEAIQDADDDKIVDNTLPGWGGWVGDGVSAREKKRQQGRFVTKVEGVAKKANRKDAKLERVIISEKRVKKNDKYLATQLPHQFESKEQYERSIRLPMGPEWVTKESHQAAVKPRVLKKQGIIAPMSRPTM